MHSGIRAGLATVLVSVLMGCNESAEHDGGGQGVADSLAGRGEVPVIEPWGYPLDAFDKTTRPQDDLYRFANGGWLDSTEIPSDRSSIGFSQGMRDRNEERIKSVVDELLAAPQAPGSEAQKIADLYRSYMNVAPRNAAGFDPIKPILKRIAAASTHKEIAALMADPMLGTPNPMAVFVSTDSKNPTRYTVYATQSGLGLPDRSYYLRDSERMKALRAGYIDYLTTVMQRLSFADAGARAKAVFAFEKALAQLQWSRAERRNADATYNPLTLGELEVNSPGYPWRLVLNTMGLGDTDKIVLRELGYFPPAAKHFAGTSVDVLRDYLRVRTFINHANLLSDEIAEENFAFFGTALRGQQSRRPLEERAILTVNRELDQAVGKIYIERFFPKNAKRQVEEMIANIKAVMADRIRNLGWMSDTTKEKALEKLEQMNARVAYPSKWQDYSALDIVSDDFIQNVFNLRGYAHQRMVARLGTTVDKEEWFRGPQTVNAFYSPTQNEIFIPAGYIQSPLFDPNADPALNYGALGSIIGHEIGHGFDDQGSKFDGKGRLNSWWTPEDRAAFDALGDKLADQFSQYEPLEGLNVNGRQTLGENIGDLAGMIVAFHAYKLSLDGKDAPVLDGFTGEQRFFLGRAQGRRYKRTDDSMRRRLLTAPHSPMYLRVNGMARNMDEFYDAFDVGPEDGMYLPPQDRVRIW